MALLSLLRALPRHTPPRSMLTIPPPSLSSQTSL